MAHPLPTPEQALAYVASCYAKWDCLAAAPTLADKGIRWQGAGDDECTRVITANVTYANGEAHVEEWDVWMERGESGALYVYGES